MNTLLPRHLAAGHGERALSSGLRSGLVPEDVGRAILARRSGVTAAPAAADVAGQALTREVPA